MRSLTSVVAALAIALLLPVTGVAQEPDSSCMVRLETSQLTGAVADIARLIDLQDTASRNSFVLRRPSRAFRGNACTAPVHLRSLAQRLSTRPGYLAPAELLVTGNSAYPRDWNDGALWGGRGIGTSLTIGARASLGPISVAILPVLTWQSNAAFETRVFADTGRSDLAHPWWGNGIDLPQRPGTSSFTTIDPGQSYARVDLFGFGAGVSNENIVWGPSRRNPLLLSATAPGFPHAFVETSRPVDIWIGDLDFQMFWGRLDESDYFDDDPDNDQRVLAGLLVALHPRILEGLSVGGTRVLAMTWWPELEASDIFLGPYRGVRSNRFGREADNQLISLFFRWSAAPGGLEVYGEWARDDHWGEWVELLRNLDVTQAWSLGMQKLIRRGDDALRISAEIVHLSDPLPILFMNRGATVFYSNTSVRQGHTHRGQLLGAPIGLGGQSQFISADWFWNRGRSSLSFERARYEDDAYDVNFASRYRAHARDTEFSVRAGHFAPVGAFSIDAEVGWSLRYNRAFLGLESLAPEEPYRRDHNWSLRLGARWTPGGGQ